MESMTRVEFASKLLNKFAEDGIKYCILRNYENLDTNIGHDIDMMIDEKSLDININDYINKVVSYLGWKCKITYNEKSFYTVICYDFNESVKLLKIDIWTQLLWRGIPWIDNGVLFETVKKYKNIYIPSDGVESAITVLKEIIGGGSVPEKYYKKIFDGVTSDKVNFIRVLEKTFGQYSYELLEKCVKKNFKFIDQQKIRVHQEIAKNRPITYILSSGWRFFKKIKKVFKPEGRLIVFVGPDGSGKSSIIDAVTKKLHHIDKRVHKYHIRLNIFPELRTGLGLSSMKGKVNEHLGENDDVILENVKLKRTFISKLASWVVVIYYALEFFIGKPIISYKKRKGIYIFFDRYFYDYYAQPTTRDIIWKYRKILSSFVTKPDIIIHLCANPEIVYRRKQELNKLEIMAQNQYIERYIQEFENAYTITNEAKSIEEITSEVFSKISDKIF